MENNLVYYTRAKEKKKELVKQVRVSQSAINAIKNYIDTHTRAFIETRFPNLDNLPESESNNLKTLQSYEKSLTEGILNLFTIK